MELYVVFLDVWQRDVTALDDPHIREVALGGPDTTTRVKNVWQVQLLPVSTETTSPPTSPPSGEVTCDTQFAEWDERTAPSTGMLNARTTIADDPKDPCLLPPSSGYRRLENQLYRVEVHTGGSRDQATFKWSRDNASVETRVEVIDGDKITVTDIGKDEVLGFAAPQWVEIVDDESELKGTPHPLFQINSVKPETREIILVQSAAAFENQPHLKLRRWDQAGLGATTDGVEMVQGWIDLEDGIQVLFSEGQYHPGDYWLIPARTATGEIDWPPFEIPNEQPIPQLPLGIRHHYCRLALLEVQAGALSLTDCRLTFPPLTDLPRGTQAEEPGITIESIRTITDNALLDNDTLVSVSRLSEGIRVRCDAPLAEESFGIPLFDPPSRFPQTVPAKPTCFVTLDLPYPLGPDSSFWRLKSRSSAFNHLSSVASYRSGTMRSTGFPPRQPSPGCKHFSSNVSPTKRWPTACSPISPSKATSSGRGGQARSRQGIWMAKALVAQGPMAGLTYVFQLVMVAGAVISRCGSGWHLLYLLSLCPLSLRSSIRCISRQDP